MRRKAREFDQIESPGGPGGGSGGGPSSSLMGSGWAKGPRPTEQPMSKMELRAAQRQARQPDIDRAKEAAREERKQRFNIRYKKGGMVKGQCRDYSK